MASDSHQAPDPRLDVADTVATLLHDIDARNWPGVRVALGEEISVDYTSLWGGEPAATSADDLLQGWQQVLTRFVATQHLLGPIVAQIDSVHATARTHVRAQHVHPEGSTPWVVGGHYSLGLQHAGGAWRVTAMRLDVHYQLGSPEPSAAATGPTA